MRRSVGGTALAALIALSAGPAGADERRGGHHDGDTRGPAAHNYHMGMGMSMTGSGMGCAYTMMGPGGMRVFSASLSPDTDRDGIVISSEAAEYFSGAFAAMDGDGDGSLTLEEFSTVHIGPGMHMAMRSGGIPPWQARKEARFKEMDPDKGGTVTLEEFIGYAKTSFEGSDGDKDGKVTVWEFRSRRHF